MILLYLLLKNGLLLMPACSRFIEELSQTTLSHILKIAKNMETSTGMMRNQMQRVN